MTLRINVISIFPEMFDALGFGMSGRALDKKALDLYLKNPRDFAKNRHRTIDDRPPKRDCNDMHHIHAYRCVWTHIVHIH